MAHLTEQDIAKAAELLANNNQSALPSEIISHLDQCPHCMENVVDIALLLQQAEAAGLLTLPKHSPKKSTKFSDYNAYFAAAGVATLLFSVIFYSSTFFDTSGSQQKIVKEEKAPFHEQISKNYQNVSPLNQLDSHNLALAESLYSPSDLYEPMVGSYLKSVAVNVVSPKVGETTVGKELIFEWKNSAQEYTIKLFNNKGIQQAEFSNLGKPLHSSLPVSNGLYYWTLEKAEKVVFTGKIYIKG